MPESSEHCGPIRKKSYSYVSGIIGIANSPFLNENIRGCFFDYEQAVLLRLWLSRIATKRSAANQQVKLGLVLEEKVTAPSVPESDKLCTGRSRFWRSRLRENPGETTHAVDNIFWEHCDESENGNRADRRLAWRNRVKSSDCTRILQQVWFFRVTIESRTET